jgi:hypothetical protein|nr:MAG TPA: hypothetical protein [Caudoviricetes sp.]
MDDIDNITEISYNNTCQRETETITAEPEKGET